MSDKRLPQTPEQRIKELEVDDITPRQALEMLAELKRLAEDQ